MSVALGVDAGGSRTTAVRHDNGRAAHGPGANPGAVGMHAAASTICAAVRALEPAASVAVFAGVAGAGRADVADALASSIQHIVGASSSVHVEGDARIALRALIPHGPGVIVVAGTGSFAYAEGNDRSIRIGGAGYLLGDEGSGFAIGQAALRLYLKTLDGRAHDTELAGVVCKQTGCADREALLALVSHSDRIGTIAAVAPVVVALADAGHRGATKIIQQASADLSELARAAAQQTGLIEQAPPVALYGGLLEKNSLLTYLLGTRIAADIPGAGILRSTDRDAAARAAATFAAHLQPA